MSKELINEKLKELEDIESYEEFMKEAEDWEEEAYKYDKEQRNLYTYKIRNLIKDGSVSKDKVLDVLFEYISGEDIGFAYDDLKKKEK